MREWEYDPIRATQKEVSELGFAIHIQVAQDKNEPEGPCVLEWGVFDAPNRRSALRVFRRLSKVADKELAEFEEEERS